MLADMNDVVALASLKSYAEKDVYDKEDMYALVDGQGIPPGDEAEFTRLIFDNTCRVVFTHEWQPIGVCRHASISFKKGFNKDIEQSIAKILILLGFNDDSEIQTYIQKDSIFNAIQLL